MNFGFRERFNWRRRKHLPHHLEWTGQIKVTAKLSTGLMMRKNELVRIWIAR